MKMKLMFLVCFLLFLVTACGEKTTSLPEHNPMGLSGKRNPEAEALFARAHVLWDKNDICSDPQLAEELLTKALDIDPDYAEAYLRRGLARSQLRAWDSAFDDLSKSIRLNPKAEAYAFRGLVSMRGGNYIGSRKDLDKSLQISKRQHRAWNFRGALNRLEGNFEAACEDFSEGCDYGDCVGFESAVARGECPK